MEGVCAVDGLWTITGLLHYDPNNPDQWSSLGQIGTGVQVQTHFYKVVVYEAGGGYGAYAVIMENREYLPQESYRQFVGSVAWLEDVLDMQFFPALDPEFAAALYPTNSGVIARWCVALGQGVSECCIFRDQNTT